MTKYYIHYIIFLILFYNISSTPSYESLKKYGNISTYKKNIVLDSSDFDKGDEIYIKISGEFSSQYISFRFYDNLEEWTGTIVGFRNEYPTKTDDKRDSNNALMYQIRYYTIEKKKDYLDSIKGNYLVIYTDMEGKYEIENTEKNEGFSKVLIICIVLGIAIIAGIITLIVCCCRKKKTAGTVTQVVVDNNGYSQNYVQQPQTNVQGVNVYGTNYGNPNKPL